MKDNFPPLLAGAVCALTISTLSPNLERNFIGFINLSLICLGVLFTCFFSLPELFMDLKKKILTTR